MVLILLCALTQMMTSVVRDEQFLPAGFSGITATIIGIIMSFYAVASIVFGIWWALKQPSLFEEWNKRFTLTANIPAYFLLALMPMFAGLVILVLIRESAWGFWLSCLSFPSVLIFLVLSLWKTRNS